MVADEGEGAKYWPRWRGPSGQGVVTGTGYVDTWSATQNVVWKTPVPGRGNSSPIVWGDRIFLTTAYEGGRRVSLLAYRRSDGRLLWETAGAAGRTDSGAHYKNGHASATPATDGERVYVSFGPRGLFAFDFDRQDRLAARPRLDGGVPRRRRVAAAVPRSHHPVPGSIPRLLHRRVRHAHGPRHLADAARRQQRVGHTDRRPRRHPRRDHRQQPAAGAGLRSRSRQGAVAVQRQHLRSHPDARRRLRHDLLLLRARGSDAGDQARRQRRRHQDASRVGEPARFAVRPVTDPVRRAALHGQRHGEHRHIAARDDRKDDVAGTAGRCDEGRIFSVAGRRGRQDLLHER